MFSKKTILICASSFLLEGVFAQINLVPNPSFEIINSCPNGAGQINKATGWHLPISGGGNPDLFNVCSTSNLVGVPLNFNNTCFQYPHSGNGYVGIDVAIYNQTNNWREYIQSKLLDTLTEGKTYCVTFYASLFNINRAYIKSLGAYLDSGNVWAIAAHGLAMVSSNMPTTLAIPQVYNATQQLSDTLNWMKIEGSFIATGIESYITLGNFFPDSTSGIGLIGNPTQWNSYYLLDDISVIDVSTPSYAGNDTLIHLGDSVFIGRPPEVGLNEDCIWYVNNVAIDTVAGMWVKPIVPTTYVLKQTICGTTRYDSIRVNIVGAGINQLTNNNVITISPNPTNGVFTISTEEVKIKEVKIINVLGCEILKQVQNDQSATIDLSDFSKGIYFVEVKTERGIVRKKLIKE